MPKANSILQGVDQITMVMGPAIAVAISAYGGIDSILLVAAVLFAVSAVNYLFLKTHDLNVTEKIGFGTLIESNRTALKVLQQ
ncbi:MFS transporter, partial [Escherichia coli]